MRPWKPASSSGRAPRATIAATPSRRLAAGVAMSYSTRTTSAPRLPAAVDDLVTSAVDTRPGEKRRVVKPVAFERKTWPPSGDGSAASRYWYATPARRPGTDLDSDTAGAE